MVQIINKSVCRGVAGKRSGKVKGVVIHNTWDNATAESHINRLASYTNSQLANGFAHYFIDHNAIVRVEDTFNGAWHVANSDGNMNYLGFEIRGNRSTPRAEFLAAEQNAFKQAAEDLEFYGLPANRDTVRLHSEFSATECPKRSLIEHIGWDSTQALPAAKRDQMKDYFIQEIKKYMKGGGVGTSPTNSTTHTVVKGDTLWSISKKYAVTVANLKLWNNLKSDTITPGQKLNVKDSSVGIHTVVKGDTLWGISKKYNTTVNKLKSDNDLKSDTISAGMKIRY